MKNTQFFSKSKNSPKYAKLGNTATKTIVAIAAVVMCLMYIAFIGVSALKSSSDSTTEISQAAAVPALKTTTFTTTVTSVSTSTLTKKITSTTTSAVCCETTTTTDTLTTATVTSTASPEVTGTDSEVAFNLLGSAGNDVTIFTAQSTVDCSITFTTSTSGVGSNAVVYVLFYGVDGQYSLFTVAYQGNTPGYTVSASGYEVVIVGDNLAPVGGPSADFSVDYQLAAICPSS